MTNIFYTSFLEGQFNITNYHNISPYDTMLCLKDLECSAEGGLFLWCLSIAPLEMNLIC